MKAAPAPAGARTVAYLVNVYPAPSHSFIRREIAALEAAGWRVHRFSHRRGEAACIDPADEDEQQRTRVLVETPWRSALAGVACVVARRPLAAVAAFAQALRMARRGDGRLVAHAGYFVLACVLGRSMGALECRHVHAHFGTNPAAVALLVHFLFGASYSLTFHGPHEFVTPDRLSLDDKIAHASFVAVVSVTGRRAIDARYPGQASKVVLVRCGLDARWFDTEPSPVPGTHRLVSVMRLELQKNPLLLAAAAARLLARGVRFDLTIVGDGSQRAELQVAIDTLHVSRCVRLAGWGTQDDVQRHLRESRALVLSSDDEGLPVAVMEAFACGRPAIATDVGGVHELVDTQTGWLVPAGDVQALADAMAQCLATPTQDLQRLADRAWRRVQGFDVRHSAKALGAAFDAVLDRVDGPQAAGRPPSG